MQFDKHQLAHRLKVFRAEKRMSQQDLANASGVAVDSIARYETAKHVMSLEVACKIADALSLPSINDLVGFGTRREG